MQILLDAFLAFFSCVGIWTLVRMILVRIITSVENDGYSKDEMSEWMKPENTTK